MGLHTSKMDISDIIKLAEKEGLTVKDVLEACLANVVTVCRMEPVQHRSYLHNQMIEDGKLVGGDNVLAVEKFFALLPLIIDNIAESMELNGALNIPRGKSNWGVIERLMIENDTSLAAYAAEKSSVAAG